jgi:hypothetical protein
MTMSPRQVARRILCRRILLVLVLLAAFPRTMFAPVITRLHDLTTGLTTDYTLLSIEADLNGKSTTPLEISHDLIQWSVLDALTPAVDGTYPLQYFFPPNTTNGFFRLDVPQVQINSVQPFTIFSGGGTFFVTGQVFDPTYSVRAHRTGCTKASRTNIRANGRGNAARPSRGWRGLAASCATVRSEVTGSPAFGAPRRASATGTPRGR